MNTHSGKKKYSYRTKGGVNRTWKGVEKTLNDTYRELAEDKMGNIEK